jgi:hypothetical protein
VNNFQQQNGLSYGANAGYGNFPSTAGNSLPPVTEASATSGGGSFHGAYDLGWISGGSFGTITSLTGDPDCARDTGVFWRSLITFPPPYKQDQFRMTLDRISLRDGVGQTLMLLENHNAQNWGANEGQYGLTWSGTAWGTYTGTNTAVLDCGVVINATPAGTGDVSFTTSVGPLCINTWTTPAVSRINGSKGISKGSSPFAGSTHPGIVTVAFCDGRVRTLNENINFGVYASLFSPGGSRRGQLVVSDSSY